MRVFARFFNTAFLSLAPVALAGLLGCEPDSPPAPEEIELTLNVKTVDLAGKPLAAVTFYINKQKVGVTFDDGEHKNVKFPVKIGDTVTFDVDAPDGYKLPSSVDKKQWRVVIEDESPRPVDLTVEFERPEREYVFLVQSGISHAAVSIDGRTVARTDDTGNVIFRTKGTPSKAFQAKVGSIVLDDKFSEGAELYVLNEDRVGPVGRTVAAKKTAVVAAQAAPKETVTSDTAAAIVQPTAVKQVMARPKPKEAPKASVKTESVQSGAPKVIAARNNPRVRRQQPSRTPADEPVLAVRPRQESPKPKSRPTVETVGAAVVVGADESSNQRNDDPIADILDEPEDQIPEPRRPEPVPAPTPEPEPPKPAPAVVEAAATGGGLLPIDEPKGVDPVAQNEPEPVPPREVDPAAGGLLAASGPKVDKQFASSNQTVNGVDTASDDKAAVKSRVKSIASRIDSGGVLTRADFEFLKSVSKKNGSTYYEANRLLGKWYFSLKKYRRQANALEEATRRGKYKHDPRILMSLAKAYGRLGAYHKALKTMRRVEKKMRRLGKKGQADAYKFYAEMLEFSFLRQYNDDPKEANFNLLGRAIRQWEKYRDFGYPASGRGLAQKKIQKLEKLKRELEL